MTDRLRDRLDSQRENFIPETGATQRFRARIASKRQRQIRVWVLGLLFAAFVILSGVSSPTSSPASAADARQLSAMRVAQVAPTREELMTQLSSDPDEGVDLPAMVVVVLIGGLAGAFALVIVAGRGDRRPS